MALAVSDKWFFQTSTGNQGPFSREQLVQFLQRGQLAPGTPVWREGMANWLPAQSVPELQGAVVVAAPPNAPAPQPQVLRSQQRDDYLDSVFSSLVKESWGRFRKREVSSEVDEVLVGAVIASTLDNGFELIDLESDGRNHYLRFEQLNSGARVIFRLSHLAESLLTSQVLGHEATVEIGYGERIRDFSRIWTAIKQELKGGFVREAEPGIIHVDGDISSQYIYVQVALLWDINDYLAPDNPYQVNYGKLTQHIGATIHALRKYLVGRFH